MTARSTPISVLVADDSDDVRTIVNLTLEEAGYAITSCANGKAAIKLVETHKFDLVITDMLMPEADGTEVVAAVRKRFPAIPIIAMSGGGSYLSADFNLGLAVRFGVTAVISKPFTPVELLKVIEAAFAKTGKT